MEPTAFEILVVNGYRRVFPARRTNVPLSKDVIETVLAEVLTTALHQERLDGEVKADGAYSFIAGRVNQVVLVLLATLEEKNK